MSKEDVKNIVIPEIPADEKILKEGTMTLSRLNYKPHKGYGYKYALTEKGVWSRSPKTLFAKPRTSFRPYSDYSSFEISTYNGQACCIFTPDGGQAVNRVFFDDMDGAVEIFDAFLPQTEPQT